MEHTVPLEVAAQHYADAAIRFKAAGVREEHYRLIQMLKKHGHYDAVLTIKRHERTTRNGTV